MNHKKELFRYLVSGICAVSTDLIVYAFLMRIISYTPAKAFSFIAGIFISYILNKFWTFQKHKKSLKEGILFITLYLSTLFINVTVNKIVLISFSNYIPFAFLCASVTSTLLNFIGMKYIVFTSNVNKGNKQ